MCKLCYTLFKEEIFQWQSVYSWNKNINILILACNKKKTLKPKILMFLQHLCIWSSILKRGIIQFSFCKSNFKKLSWFLYQWKLSYLPSWFYFVLKLLPSWRKVEGKLFIPRRLIYQCCSKTQSTFVIYKKTNQESRHHLLNILSIKWSLMIFCCLLELCFRCPTWFLVSVMLVNHSMSRPLFTCIHWLQLWCHLVLESGRFINII